MTQNNINHTENHSKIEEMFTNPSRILYGSHFKENLILGENHGSNSEKEILEYKLITNKEEKIEYIHLFKKYIKEWENAIRKNKVAFKQAQRDGDYSIIPSCMSDVSFYYELRHFLRGKFNDE